MSHAFTFPAAAGGLNGVHKFGRNPDIDMATDPEDVWAYGGLKTLLAAAATLYISSDAAADQSVEITVEYLDANWLVQTVIGTTDPANGRVFVSLGVTAWRVNRAWVSDASVLAGNVYVSSDNTDAGGDGIPDTVANIEGYIPAADHQTLQAIYTIPAGKVGHAAGWYASLISTVATSRATVRLVQKQLGKTKRTVEVMGISVGGPPMINHWPMTQSFPAQTTLLVEVVEVSHNDLDIAGGFYLRLSNA